MLSFENLILGDYNWITSSSFRSFRNGFRGKTALESQLRDSISLTMLPLYIKKLVHQAYVQSPQTEHFTIQMLLEHGKV